MNTYSKLSSSELRQKLTPLQYEVTQCSSTEPPFQNEYWDLHEEGLFVDVTTGEPLFCSRDKFDSGTGWPSFTRPIKNNCVSEHPDTSHGSLRTEVRSLIGKSHLGHVFEDGPKPSEFRYCINSAALRFVPLSELQAEGYGAYEGLFREKAVLAGGCFWGMQEILRQVPGVIETQVGYAGGHTENPTYEEVKQGHTGHAEAVQVIFDPLKLSYADLLNKWFFKMHDPTTLNQQGHDRGSQYRSAIYYTSEAQKKVAEACKKQLGAATVTEISQATVFTRAESYHQDYLQKNPSGYTCHFLRK